MTDEKLKYRAKINAKGLDNTGVGEDLARALASRLGTRQLMIVEARAVKTTLDEEGNQQVQLALEQVEPVPADQEEVVREFLRALYRSRPEQQGQAVLTGADAGEPTLAQTSTALQAATPDPVPDPAWDGDPDAPLEAAPEGAWPGDEEYRAAQVAETPNDLDAGTAAAAAISDAAQPAGTVVSFSGGKKRKA